VTSVGNRPFHANLEALRGIAALLVVLHHLSLTDGSFLSAVAPLRQGWLFVDLFFVLSGYVIASVHAESEATPLAAGRFLIRRFFRLYPLHVLTLGAALILDFHDGTARLAGYGAMVAMNLTMTHAWGAVPGSVLNGPSWSISTEWAAYLLFAWICLMTPVRRRRLQLLGAVGLVSLASLLWWRGGSLDGDLLFRLPRCLFSFALGAAVWAGCRNRNPIGPRRAATLQVLAALTILCLLVAAGRQPQLTLLMPLASAMMIAAMALDPGSPIRRQLERSAPQWLGRCSYSLYMLHMPLFGCLLLVTPGGRPTDPVLVNLWIGAALCILLAGAALTQSAIERPWREFGRRLADALQKPNLSGGARVPGL
jgi:peptidoglycan/LPS O-acetylase OafA/YrhL